MCRLQAIVRGAPETAERASIGSGGGAVLTPEQQMEYLFDLATAASVLGRAYAGWRPYV